MTDYHLILLDDPPLLTQTGPMLVQMIGEMKKDRVSIDVSQILCFTF